MGYNVEILPDVVDYIAAIAGLPADGQTSVLQGVIAELGESADDFFDKYPLGHESLSFRYDYAHPTPETLFNFEFIVDVSAREMGVVRVVYAECATEPMRDAE